MPGARGIPSVTEVLGAAGLGWDGWRTTDVDAQARALARGRAVHAAIALCLEDRLDRASLHPTIAPYLAAFDAFRLNQPEPAQWWEREIVHPHELLLGHPDVLLDDHTLVDWKTGQTVDEDSAALQLSAYEWLLREAGVRVDALWAVGLRPDGTYRVHDVTVQARRERHVVEAAVVVWHARQARRLRRAA